MIDNIVNFNMSIANQQDIKQVVYESIVRQQMIHLITRFVLKQKSMNRNDEDDTTAKITSKFASVIEKHLYKQSATFAEYADRQTLKQRVKIASLKVIKRRLASKNVNDKCKRQNALRRTVGEEKYHQIMNIKNQIQSLRLQLCASSTSCNSISCANERSTSQQSTPSKKITTTYSQENLISSPVRSLFFNIKLLHEIEFASVERIPNLDWDTMIEQANNAIELYKKWTADPTTRTKLTFHGNSDASSPSSLLSSLSSSRPSSSSSPSSSLSTANTVTNKTKVSATVIPMLPRLPTKCPSQDARAA